MKKHLTTCCLLIVSGAFVYFGVNTTPSYAASITDDEAYVASFDQYKQDTVPGTDTSRHKSKMKHKMKKDTTWKKDSIPQ
ncbi:hypothetical protein [Chitinophaga pinensis]|uniref:Secreted protein n=1 Tax=Chitinophaga pinensis (strain ATCC 43595 / DSM 2588 / LMG 13176 / NBRC 15968 / NCIMB 11800 / UQM 2034) TaxID=485918 RepID=A0A979GQP5_CHIPD|nr:hypothetical protein [Chitinophaga pinensis]ACU60273.1 hypothetical protein Cpin_2794 [Chitinophaga pinensis DSM 2588]